MPKPCRNLPLGLALLFLLCALPTGLGCALLSPPGAPPDEMAAVARADGLRLGIITSIPSPTGAQGVLVDSGTDNLIFLMDMLVLGGFDVHGPIPPRIMADAATIRWSGRTVFCTTQMIAYFPLLYLPDAASLWAAKAAGLRPLRAVYATRLVMLLLYLAMGFAAVRLARFGAGLLFATLTLPTSLVLAASCSQEGLMIASCALAASLLTRASPATRLGALALLTTVALSKVTFAPLMLFCLAPLRAPGLARRAAAVALAAVLPALWLRHVQHMGFAPWPWPPYHPGPLWPGDRSIWLRDARPAGNIRVFLAHPAQLLLLPLHSLAVLWRTIWPRVLACVSVDDVLIRPWEYPLLAAALLLAALAPARAGRPWPPADAAFALLLLFGCFMSIELSIYLTYTPTGAALITGVQGRYFLLLLPFCIFPLSWAMAHLPWRRQPALLFALPAVAMALVNIVALPLFLHQLFRLAGP